jgi:hypothetical protein
MPTIAPSRPTWRSQPEGRRLLDRDARRHGRGQDRLAVLLGLPLEERPRGHRDDACADAFGVEPLVGLNREIDLGAGCDQDHVRIVVAREQRG